MKKEDVQEIQRKRFLFLNKVYDVAQQRTTAICKLWEIGKDLGFDPMLTQDIFAYLSRKGLIKGMGLDKFCITPPGIDAVEEALTNRDKSTEYFPSINVMYVEKADRSQIQQSGPGATQTILISENKYDDVKEVIQLLEKSLEKSELQENQIADLRGDIQAIKAQLSKANPNSGIITAALKSIQTLLLSAGGSMLAQGVLPTIAALFTGS